MFSVPMMSPGRPSILRPASPAGRMYVAPTPGVGRALDAADGVIDGRYFGTPIANRGVVPVPVISPITSIAPITPMPQVMATRYGPASAALDAADGLMDGKYFGSPIIGEVSSVSVPSMIAPVAIPPRFTSAATTLDAMDGVIDGKYFGSRILGEVTPTVPVLVAPPSPTYPCTAVSVPPVDMGVITNVPPLGSTSVSVVDCGTLAPTTIPITTPVHFSQPHVHSSTITQESIFVKREIPGAASIAQEFRDLRDMLDKDRHQFEMTRQEFERSITERELKLKMDRESLTGEWSRFHAEESSFKDLQAKKLQELEDQKKKDTIVVKTMKEAQDLDVKDGIIDGKFNGKQIVIEGTGPLIPPPHLMGKRVPPPGGKGIGPAGKGMGGPHFVLGKGLVGAKGEGKGMGKGGPPIGKGAVPMGKGAPAGKGGPPAGKGGPPAGKGATLGKGGAPPAGKGKGGRG